MAVAAHYGKDPFAQEVNVTGTILFMPLAITKEDGQQPEGGSWDSKRVQRSVVSWLGITNDFD